MAQRPNRPHSNRRRLRQVFAIGSLVAVVPTAARAQQFEQTQTLGLSVPAQPISVVDKRLPHEVAPGVSILPDRC